MDLPTYKLLLTILAGLATLAMGAIALWNVAHGKPGALGDLAGALLGGLVTLGMTLGLGASR